MPRGTQEPPSPLFGFAYGAFTLYGQAFQPVPLPNHGSFMEALQPRTAVAIRFGLIPFRSPLLWESLLISLPWGTKMFQFPQFPLPGLCVQPGVSRFYLDELPHSGIPGLAYLTASRGLSQPSHALHRLLAPRHPPHALSSFCTGTKQKTLFTF